MKAMVALAAAFSLAVCGMAPAQPPADEGVRMSLDYDGMLYPLNLVPVKVLVVHADGRSSLTSYNASVAMRSYGILRAFKHIDITAQAAGRVDGERRPHPETFSYLHHDGKRIRNVHVVWSPNDVSMTSTPPFHDMGTPVPTLAQKLEADDPLSQFVSLALATTPSGVCGAPDRFFDGKQLYALEFTHGEATKLSPAQAKLGFSRAMRCTIKYVEIAGFNPKPPDKRDQGLRSPITMVFGQLGPTGPWVIIDINAETVIGYADIALRGIRLGGQHL
jgi:hypothetical protein